MFSNVNVSSEVCLFTRVSLADVDRHKVGQAGEFGCHLAKLTELGHEGGSGAGAKVDDERSAWLAPAEERDHTPGLQVVQFRAGGLAAFLRVFERITYTSVECLLYTLSSHHICFNNLPTLTVEKENKYSMSSTLFTFSANFHVPVVSSFFFNILREELISVTVAKIGNSGLKRVFRTRPDFAEANEMNPSLNMKSGAKTLIMFTARKKTRAPGTDRNRTERSWRHLYGAAAVICILSSS